eukprot:m.124206 g.124206  ORF g.124206 m.124206 type:complete len:107 (-) comp13491_c0_seq2:102-422(-)
MYAGHEVYYCKCADFRDGETCTIVGIKSAEKTLVPPIPGVVLCTLHPPSSYQNHSCTFGGDFCSSTSALTTQVESSTVLIRQVLTFVYLFFRLPPNCELLDVRQSE